MDDRGFSDHDQGPEPDGAPRRLAVSVRCISCGYDLIGLDSGGLCPECATPVDHSTRGTLLQYAAAEHIRTLLTGARLILAALLGTILLILASVGVGVYFAINGMTATPGPAGPLAPPTLSGPMLYVNLASTAFSVVLAFVSLAGWWMLARPNPAYTGVDVGETPRRLIRIAVVIRAVITALNLPVTLLTMSSPPAAIFGPIWIIGVAFGVIAAGAWLLQFFASMLYIRWLALRIPDTKMYRSAGRYMWLLPILYVVGVFCFGLGPLIAFILYILLIDQLRRDLKSIVIERSAEA